MPDIANTVLTDTSILSSQKIAPIWAKRFGMDSFGSRLKIARERHAPRLSMRALGELLSVSDAAVAQWESGKTLPEGKTLLALPRVLGVHPLWLLYGLGLPEQTKADTLPNGIRLVGDLRVAHVTAAQATADMSAAVAAATRTVPAVHDDVQPGDCGIDIWDDSNSPEFSIDDYVIMRPLSKMVIQPGDYVLVSIGPTSSPTFGQIGRGPDGGWVLHYRNQLWGSRPLNQADKIVAVMCAHVRKIRRRA